MRSGITNREDDCRILEPWTPARDALAKAFFGQREPNLNELWSMSGDAAEVVLRQHVGKRAWLTNEPYEAKFHQIGEFTFGSAS